MARLTAATSRPGHFCLPRLSQLPKAPAPDHSPPKPKPWQKRKMVKRTGANKPICIKVGSKPIRKVAIPMVKREPTKVALRPIPSPKCPKRIEPMGRATKATPKVAIEAKSAARGITLRKKKKRKNRNRGCGIDIKIIKLNGCADHAGNDDAFVENCGTDAARQTLSLL